MSYTAPTITGSGLTLAQLKAAGASGHVKAVAAANTLTPRAAMALGTAAAGKFERLWAEYSQLIHSYVTGRPIAAAELIQHHLDLATALAALMAVVNEAGVLIAANPGTPAFVADGPNHALPIHTLP